MFAQRKLSDFMNQTKTSSKQINQLFQILSEYYGDSILRNGWQGTQSWWQANSAFELMVGSILVQNTNWRNVVSALRNFGENLNPEYVLSISNEELAQVIRPAGFQNQKAKKLKAFCEWFQVYHFDIEEVSQINTALLRKELLSINGVGNETADAILVYVLNKTSFVIDAYTRRIFSRFGFDVPKSYNDLQEMIATVIPCDIATYDYYHGLMVEHAKIFCNKKPKCDNCPLMDICKKIGIES